MDYLEAKEASEKTAVLLKGFDSNLHTEMKIQSNKEKKNLVDVYESACKEYLDRIKQTDAE